MPETAFRTLDLDWSAESVQRALARIREADCVGEDSADEETAEISSRAACDRRTAVRHPLVTPAFLIPAQVVESRATVQEDGELPVISLDIGPHGLGIQHDRRIQSQYSIVAFDLWNDGSVALLVEKRWSMPGNGTYRTGFRVLAVVREG